MNLRVELVPGPVIAVHGELDLEGAPELRTVLVDAIEEHPGQDVVVDLEGVGFIDSAGISVLLGGLERAAAVSRTPCRTRWRRHAGVRARR